MAEISSNAGNGSRIKLEIKKFNAVAAWSWDTPVDNCAICRNHIMDQCIECQANTDSKTGANGGSTGKECTVAWGTCNHAFHKHCITKWLTTRKVCPLDNKAWTYQENKK